MVIKNNFIIKKILENKNSNKTIFRDKKTNISWKKLYKISNFNSKKLSKYKPNNVLIVCDRSIETVIAITTVILSGKTFCPVSEKIPTKKIKFIMKKLKTNLIINTAKKNYKNLKFKKINIHKKFVNKNENFNNKSIKNDICYILFTSGSTGEPKGVILSYSNLQNTIDWSKNYLNWKKNDTIGIATNFSFDISMFDFISSIYHNVKSVIFSAPENPLITFNEIKTFKVTSIFSVPNFFSNFIYYNLIEKSFGKLRRIISGGDFFIPKAIKIWKQNHPKIDIFNVWGPTETSIVNTMHKIRNKEISKIIKEMKVPVGKSKREMEIKIFHKKKFTNKPFQKGEICIFGKSVSEGYIGNINENKKYIFFGKKRGFLTGDIGYFDEKNNLFIVGRNDSTVKISGYRVDLKEIENISNKLKEVNESRAFTVKKEKFSYITLCVTANNINVVKKIKNIFQNELPQYSIPKKILFFKNFPKNANNKINFKRLNLLANK